MALMGDPYRKIALKLDQIDWVARHSEFLSSEALSKAIFAMRELAKESNFSKADHSSLVSVTICNLIRHQTKLATSD